jgi:hypothetical protein
VAHCSPRPSPHITTVGWRVAILVTTSDFPPLFLGKKHREIKAGAGATTRRQVRCVILCEACKASGNHQRRPRRRPGGDGCRDLLILPYMDFFFPRVLARSLKKKYRPDMLFFFLNPPWPPDDLYDDVYVARIDEKGNRVRSRSPRFVSVLNGKLKFFWLM